MSAALRNHGLDKELDGTIQGVISLQIYLGIIGLVLVSSFIINDEAFYYLKQFNNPTRSIASSFAFYTRSLGWQMTGELNSVPSFAGILYGYDFSFQTTQCPTQVKDYLLSFLNKNGYSTKSLLYVPIDMSKPPGIGWNRDLDIQIEQDGVVGTTLNDEKPYWIVQGELNSVSFLAEITDRTYPQSDEKVPSGMTIVRAGFVAEDPSIQSSVPKFRSVCVGAGCDNHGQ